MPDSALHLAAFWNRQEIIKLTLSKGADPSVCGYMRRTPLHCASVMGNVEAINTLIAGEADVDSISYKRVYWRLLKQTALSLAIGFKQTKPTGALRKAGAETRKPIYDIDHRVERKGMETLLNRAVRQKLPDVKAIEIR
jgi:ankyrin repeat protein